MLELTSSPLYYLPLAGSDVQQLRCAAKTDDEDDWLDVPAIARRTNLTELSLTNIHDLTDFHRLRSLALEKLTLAFCPGAEVALFVPGALTALKTLSIYEGKNHLIAFDARLRQDSSPDSEEQRVARQISEAGTALLSLPNLVKVKGNCKFFLLGIINEQIGWKKTYKFGSCKPLACLCLSCRCASQDWVKLLQA